ncbi:MAG: RpoL/Rpb11 RNA polymerase subunit family protein [Nanobdellota archaeon]
MEIKIIEDKKSRVVFELVGADHTIANILKEKIAQQKGVSACSYNVEHPMVSNPKFFIEAESAKKAIETAVDELKKENDDLKKQIK